MEMDEATEEEESRRRRMSGEVPRVGSHDLPNLSPTNHYQKNNIHVHHIHTSTTHTHTHTQRAEYAILTRMHE